MLKRLVGSEGSLVKFLSIPERVYIIVLINSICLQEKLHSSVSLQEEENIMKTISVRSYTDKTLFNNPLRL